MKKKLTGWIGLFTALSAIHGTAHAMQWGEEDHLRDFVGRTNGETLITNARNIESMRLMESALATDQKPWSSTFWPDNKGSIADPYVETGSFFLENILKKWHWTTSRPFLVGRSELHRNALIQSQEVLDNMAPSEKYDLLMGDLNFTLTNRVIKMIDDRAAINLTGTWSGVCHGWSPSSLNVKRPLHAFKVESPLGPTLTFFPDDVKALTAFLWGKSPVQNSAKSEGLQCQSGAHRDKYGRLTDPRCFDVNPAFFHMAAVNQIGLNHQGFIIDRDYTTAVQNQPVYAYRFKYYKVTDRHPSFGKTLNEAKVYYASNIWDPYKAYRSPRATALVGVEATLWFGYEKDPVHSLTDDPSKDEKKDMTFRYDLELDNNDNIVGGEWRDYDDVDAPTLAEQTGYKHPDMMWLIPAGMHAYSVADADTGSTQWTGYGPVPQVWREAAIRAANNTEIQPYQGKNYTIPQPQPLGKVVETLNDLSRR